MFKRFFIGAILALTPSMAGLGEAAFGSDALALPQPPSWLMLILAMGAAGEVMRRRLTPARARARAR